MGEKKVKKWKGRGCQGGDGWEIGQGGRKGEGEQDEGRGGD